MIEISLNNAIFDRGIAFPDGGMRPFVFTVKGHAGLAPKGEDLVCAAVSALAQTLAISLVRIARVGSDIEKESGFLRIEFVPGHLGQEERKIAMVLIDSFLAGIGEIVKEYPASVKIDFTSTQEI